VSSKQAAGTWDGIALRCDGCGWLRFAGATGMAGDLTGGGMLRKLLLKAGILSTPEAVHKHGFSGRGGTRGKVRRFFVLSQQRFVQIRAFASRRGGASRTTAFPASSALLLLPLPPPTFFFVVVVVVVVAIVSGIVVQRRPVETCGVRAAARVDGTSASSVWIGSSSSYGRTCGVTATTRRTGAAASDRVIVRAGEDIGEEALDGNFAPPLLPYNFGAVVIAFRH